MSNVALDEGNSVILEFAYSWKVHVKDLFSDHDVKSPAFNRPDADTGSWRLEMVGCQDANGDLCVRVGVRLLPESKSATGRVRFSIEGTEFQGSDVTEDFSPLEAGDLSSVMYALPLVVITKWANGKIEDQNLTVHCHLWLLLRSITYPMSNIQSQAEKVINSKLEREDLWSKTSRLWGCDVIIRCQNVSVHGDKKFDRVSHNTEIIGDPDMDFLSREFVGEKSVAGRPTAPVFVPYIPADAKPSVVSTAGKPERKCTPKSPRAKDVRSHNNVAGILAARAFKQGDGDDNLKLRRFAENHLLCDSESETTIEDSSMHCGENNETGGTEAHLRGWILEWSADGGHDSGRRNLKSSSVMRTNSDTFREGPYTDFPVHREVLRRRSPAFRAMLKDSSLNMINVFDVDASVMNELLRFLYTGSVAQDAFPDKAESLLYASSKYDIAYLKNQCEFILSNTLNVQNACRLMLASDRYRAAVLKENVIAYAVKEHQDIFRSLEYRKFQNEHPQLANELMISVFSNVTASRELYVR